MFILEDGQIAYGNGAAVQYSGAGGRDPLFLARDFIPVIDKEIKPFFKGREITSLREMTETFEAYTGGVARMHTALSYGVSQAVLDAVAKAQHKMMAEIVVKEYNTGCKIAHIPILHSQAISAI